MVCSSPSQLFSRAQGLQSSSFRGNSHFFPAVDTFQLQQSALIQQVTPTERLQSLILRALG